MTFREVLQTELWSKETSRKILKFAGFSVVAVFVAGAVVFAVAALWVNPYERRVARISLAAVDSLQPNNVKSEDEYNRRKDEAEAAVEKLDAATLTLRDEQVAQSLHGYLFLTEMQHDEPSRLELIREFYYKHPQMKPYDDSAEKQSAANTQQGIELIRQSLHHALD